MTTRWSGEEENDSDQVQIVGKLKKLQKKVFFTKMKDNIKFDNQKIQRQKGHGQRGQFGHLFHLESYNRMSNVAQKSTI